MAVCLDYLSGDAKDELAATTQQESLPTLPMTGTAGDILPLQENPHPSLRLERISNEATIRDFVDLNSMSYNLSIEAGRSLVKEHTLWRDHAFGFVG
jgi:hypothetical protein